MLSIQLPRSANRTSRDGMSAMICARARKIGEHKSILLQTKYLFLFCVVLSGEKCCVSFSEIVFKSFISYNKDYRENRQNYLQTNRDRLGCWFVKTVSDDVGYGHKQSLTHNFSNKPQATPKAKDL